MIGIMEHICFQTNMLLKFGIVNDTIKKTMKGVNYV